MKIVAFAEQRNGQFRKNTFEVVRAAGTLADQFQAEAVALVIGSNVKNISAELGLYGATRVCVIDEQRLGDYSATAYAKAIAETMKELQADVLLFSASSMGKDLAPRVSVKLNAGLVSDCISLNVENGSIIASRPVYAGKAIVDIVVKSDMKLFSLRPNVFPSGGGSGSPATVETISIPLDDADFSCSVKEIKIAGGKKDVAEADIIVSGGRGMKGPENFTMLEEMAGVLNAAVGASRAAVDAGWRPHSEQVGQTGKTVSPNLYIAVGISGAVQHLAGMSSSKYIVAINKDKDAPIFSIADFGIVADAFTIVPALTAELKKALGK